MDARDTAEMFTARWYARIRSGWSRDTLTDMLTPILADAFEQGREEERRTLECRIHKLLQGDRR